MTPNEITTLLGTNLGKELDVPFKKMLYERVKYWRATLIKQTLDRHKQDGKYFRQTIYLPMDKVNILNADPQMLRWAAVTMIEVPLPIRDSDHVFDYVGGIDGKSPFGYADVGTLSYLTSGKYARLFNYQQYINKKIYTEQIPDIPYIRIDGIFNSPEEAVIYQTIPPQPNFDWWDSDIPMSGDIEQRVIQCILTVDYQRPPREKTDDYQTPINDEKL